VDLISQTLGEMPPKNGSVRKANCPNWNNTQTETEPVCSLYCVQNVKTYSTFCLGRRNRGPRPPFPLPFVKNVVQIAFLTHGCCKAISVSLCGYLSVGQLNNEKWPTCLAHTLCWELGLSEPEIGLEHDKCQNLHGARLQKQLQTALVLPVTFIWSHLIRESASTAFDVWLYLFFLLYPPPPPPPPPPPLPRRQHSREHFFRCTFYSKSASRNQCHTQLFDASWREALPTPPHFVNNMKYKYQTKFATDYSNLKQRNSNLLSLW
jgi:hypothetical protein